MVAAVWRFDGRLPAQDPSCFPSLVCLVRASQSPGPMQPSLVPPTLLQTWQEPWQSVAAMLGACFLCFAPRLAIPLLLAWVVFSTLAAQPEFEGEQQRLQLPVPLPHLAS